MPTVIPVVAVALVTPGPRVLMQKRRAGRHFGGLWEFPGGKIEPDETPESALLREITEELGIALDAAALQPLTFASGAALPAAQRQPHVILLYICRKWAGEPQCLDGDDIGWFTPDELRGLAMPPLDYPLAEALLKAI